MRVTFECLSLSTGRLRSCHGTLREHALRAHRERERDPVIPSPTPATSAEVESGLVAGSAGTPGLRQHSPLSDPMGDDFDYGEESPSTSAR